MRTDPFAYVTSSHFDVALSFLKKVSVLSFQKVWKRKGRRFIGRSIVGVVFAGSVMYVDQTEPSPASDPLDSHYGSVVDEPQLS
jgi:hypothetical protein